MLLSHFQLIKLQKGSGSPITPDKADDSTLNRKTERKIFQLNIETSRDVMEKNESSPKDQKLSIIQRLARHKPKLKF